MLRKKMSRPHSRSESHPKMLSCFTTTTDSFAGQSISVCVRLVDAEALEEVSDARLVPHILTLHAIWFIRDTVKSRLLPSLKFWGILTIDVPYLSLIFMVISYSLSLI